MEPMTRSEILLSATAGEYDGELPTPVTREEYILTAIYNKIGNGIYGSPESVGQAMTDYVGEHPEFWNHIPDNTITRDMLADEVPEQIRDETMQPLSDEDIASLLNPIF